MSLLLDRDSEAASRQFGCDIFYLLCCAAIHNRLSLVVNAVGELKGLGRCHSRNKSTEQIDDLLVCVAVAIKDDYTGFESGSGSGFNLFSDVRESLRRRRGRHSRGILADLGGTVKTCFGGRMERGLGKNLLCGRETTLVPRDGFACRSHVGVSGRQVDSGSASAIHP